MKENCKTCHFWSEQESLSKEYGVGICKKKEAIAIDAIAALYGGTLISGEKFYCDEYVVSGISEDVAKVAAVVYVNFKVGLRKIKSPIRKPHIAASRRILQYVLFHYFGWSHEEIGEETNKHRTSVIAACKKVEDEFDIHGSYEHLYKKVIAKFEK